jgi:hypothetical protein
MYLRSLAVDLCYLYILVPQLLNFRARLYYSDTLLKTTSLVCNGKPISLNRLPADYSHDSDFASARYHTASKLGRKLECCRSNLDATFV